MKLFLQGATKCWPKSKNLPALCNSMLLLVLNQLVAGLSPRLAGVFTSSILVALVQVSIDYFGSPLSVWIQQRSICIRAFTRCSCLPLCMTIHSNNWTPSGHINTESLKSQTDSWCDVILMTGTSEWKKKIISWPELYQKDNIKVMLNNRSYRSLNAVVAQIKNWTFLVNTMIDLRTIKTTSNNKNKQNTIKFSNLEAIPEYYSGVLVEITFPVAHLSNTSFLTYAASTFSERHERPDCSHVTRNSAHVNSVVLIYFAYKAANILIRWKTTALNIKQWAVTNVGKRTFLTLPDIQQEIHRKTSHNFAKQTNTISRKAVFCFQDRIS
jgi:hypothetical protein